MKAIRVHPYGKPAQLCDVPEPRVTSPDEVIVGGGPRRTDLHIIDGWFAWPGRGWPGSGHLSGRWCR